MPCMSLPNKTAMHVDRNGIKRECKTIAAIVIALSNENIWSFYKRKVTQKTAFICLFIT